MDRRYIVRLAIYRSTGDISLKWRHSAVFVQADILSVFLRSLLEVAASFYINCTNCTVFPLTIRSKRLLRRSIVWLNIMSRVLARIRFCFPKNLANDK